MYTKKFLNYQKKIEALKEEGGKKLTTTNSGYFSRFVILNKILGDAKWGMEWCQWLYSLYNNGNITNIFDENPF